MGGAVVKVAKQHIERFAGRKREQLTGSAVSSENNQENVNAENVPPTPDRPPLSLRSANSRVRPPLHPIRSSNQNRPPLQERKAPRKLSINTNVTPRKIVSRQNFLDCGYGSIGCTPQGPQKDTYKFYCPLCMYYFKGTIFVTSCCGNHACFNCAISYLAGKQQYPTGLQYVPKSIHKKIHCPHCGTAPFKFNMLKKGRTVRSYDNSPETTKRLELLKVTSSDIEDAKKKKRSLTNSFDFNVQPLPDWDTATGGEDDTITGQEEEGNTNENEPIAQTESVDNTSATTTEEQEVREVVHSIIEKTTASTTTESTIEIPTLHFPMGITPREDETPRGNEMPVVSNENEVPVVSIDRNAPLAVIQAVPVAAM
eukprot:g2972.t1